MINQIDADIIVDVCPGQIDIRPPCWINREKIS